MADADDMKQRIAPTAADVARPSGQTGLQQFGFKLRVCLAGEPSSAPHVPPANFQPPQQRVSATEKRVAQARREMQMCPSHACLRAHCAPVCAHAPETLVVACIFVASAA